MPRALAARVRQRSSSIERRLVAGDAARLAESELLAVLVDGDVAVGARLLGRLGGFDELRRAGARELIDRALVKWQVACRLEAALELGRRAAQRPIDRGEPIGGPHDVDRRLRARLVDLEHEELHVLGLDAHLRVLTHFVAAVGTLNRVYASPRDVFRPLVRESAQGAIVVHNHPSGDPTPSSDDDALTLRLAEAGDLVGITLIDHVVIARAGPFSFVDAGRLPRRTLV